MAQARRIKPKAKAKSRAKKPRQNRNIPWALLIVILICGVVLGMLLNGSKNGDSLFGAGLKALFETSDSPAESEDKAIKELIDKTSTEKKFDFYTLLPDIEKVMPDDLPDATPEPSNNKYDYYLQAASFKKHADAEKLRARIALKGFKSITQARSVEGKGTLYRVRVGPYADKRKAKTAKNKLQKLGVRPFVFTVKK
jgi:hypothetical protein